MAGRAAGAPAQMVSGAAHSVSNSSTSTPLDKGNKINTDSNSLKILYVLQFTNRYTATTTINAAYLQRDQYPPPLQPSQLPQHCHCPLPCRRQRQRHVEVAKHRHRSQLHGRCVLHSADQGPGSDDAEGPCTGGDGAGGVCSGPGGGQGLEDAPQADGDARVAL